MKEDIVQIIGEGLKGNFLVPFEKYIDILNYFIKESGIKYVKPRGSAKYELPVEIRDGCKVAYKHLNEDESVYYKIKMKEKLKWHLKKKF